MDEAYPLSLSMPLVVDEHEHARIEPWLWGLLPDNDAILARWGQRFHVSPRNAFALLGATGEDCAGAIQLVHPDRVDEARADGLDHPILQQMIEILSARSERCAHRLETVPD